MWNWLKKRRHVLTETEQMAVDAARIRDHAWEQVGITICAELDRRNLLRVVDRIVKR